MARERSHGPAQDRRHAQDKSKTRPPSTATTLFSGTQRTDKRSIVCCYCQQSHSPADCLTVVNLDARRQILKSSGRCFNCLTKGHTGKRCHAPPQYQTSKRKHHPSICNQTAEVDQGSPQGSTEPTNVSISTLNPKAESYVSNSTTSVFCSMNVKSVLLQTARAVVYNLRTLDFSTELRILLDCGSQQSYITDRARRMLKIDPQGAQQLSIAAFGSRRGGPKVCPIVRVGILLKGYPSMNISLFVVPMICEPLINQSIDLCIKQNPHQYHILTNYIM